MQCFLQIILNFLMFHVKQNGNKTQNKAYVSSETKTQTKAEMFHVKRVVKREKVSRETRTNWMELFHVKPFTVVSLKLRHKHADTVREGLF